jgi:hypothetical protein
MKSVVASFEVGQYFPAGSEEDERNHEHVWWEKNDTKDIQDV